MFTRVLANASRMTANSAIRAQAVRNMTTNATQAVKSNKKVAAAGIATAVAGKKSYYSDPVIVLFPVFVGTLICVCLFIYSVHLIYCTISMYYPFVLFVFVFALLCFFLFFFCFVVFQVRTNTFCLICFHNHQFTISIVIQN